MTSCVGKKRKRFFNYRSTPRDDIESRQFGASSNFKLIKYIILSLFILMQIYLIFIKKHDSLDIDVYPNTVPSPNIYQDIRIGQTFVAQRNNLARIDIMFGTHGRKNDENVFFRLWEMNPKRKLVTEVVFDASEVRNNLYTPIRFKPLKNSKDKKYSFIFSSLESTYDNSICIWMNKKNIYKDGDFLLKNNVSRGDLVFRVYSKRPIYSELDRIVRNYSGIFKNKIFLLAAIVFFEIIQILFLAKLLDMIYINLRSHPADKKRRPNV